jgi:hypothetical protein
MQNKFREWALLAQAIAHQQTTHHHRENLIEPLLADIEAHDTIQPRQLWSDCLVYLLKRGNTHREVKLSLKLFVATCNYLADTWNDMYVDYRKRYDKHGREVMTDFAPPDDMDGIPF